MSEEYKHIRVSVNDRVGRITFARPPLNVFDIAMMREIDQALNNLSKQRELVAVCFDAAAETRAWSAGVAVEDHAPETIYQMLDSFHQIFRTLEGMAKPTVAVVDGAALGGGCELIAACDFVFASERARFGQPEIKLGVFPPIAAILLPRLIGEKRARELILTGELIDATEAARIGLITRAVPSAQLEAKTEETLNQLRELSSAALEMTRRALDAARGRTFDDALQTVEDLYLNDLMKTADAAEGINAFMEKRKPVWRNK